MLNLTHFTWQVHPAQLFTRFPQARQHGRAAAGGEQCVGGEQNVGSAAGDDFGMRHKVTPHSVRAGRGSGVRCGVYCRVCANRARSGDIRAPAPVATTSAGAQKRLNAGSDPWQTPPWPGPPGAQRPEIWPHAGRRSGCRRAGEIPAVAIAARPRPAAPAGRRR